MTIERRDHGIAAQHIHVIQNNSYANATFCSGMQATGEISARNITVPDVILGIDTAFRCLYQTGTLQESVLPRVKHPESGQAGMRLTRRGGYSLEAGCPRAGIRRDQVMYRRRGQAGTSR